MLSGDEIQVLLCQTSLDVSYSNTVDFENEENQMNYFSNILNSKIYHIDGKADAFRTIININDTIGNLGFFDYVILIDKHQFKKYFYFITNKQMITLSTTQLELKLDVFQTYMFSYEFLDTFVDRCHVNRWRKNGLPTENNLDEELEYGSTRIIKTEELKNIQDNFIIVSSTPIGELENNGGDTGGGGGGGEVTPPAGEEWKNGLPSKNLLRMLKGYEGFSPYIYRDSGGVSTIGYGTTSSDTDAWNYLTANQPVTEEMASKKMWEKLCNNYAKVIATHVKTVYKVDNQNKFDSLVDLAYNGGNGIVTNMNNSLPQALKKEPNNESYVRPIWEKYIIKDNAGNILQGLILRRKAECNMYFKNEYEFRKIPKLDKNGNVNGYIDGNGWQP